MSAPTTYTYDEFADYLKDEVLVNAAKALGWGDTTEARPRSYVEDTVTSNTGSYGVPTRSDVVVPRTQLFIRTGTTIIFSGGLTRTTLGDFAEGSTTLIVTPALTLNQVQGQTYQITTSAEVVRVRNPNYDLVTDEVLNQMGLTNINQVDATNVYKFRLLGRLEILRRVFENSAADYTYSSEGGTAQSRSQVPSQLQRLFLYEQERIAREIFELEYVTPTPIIKEEMLSGGTSVGMIW